MLAPAITLFRFGGEGVAQFENVMQDLSKGYVPVVILLAGFGGALVAGQWINRNEMNVSSVAKQVTDLQTQVAGLSTQVAQLSIAIAKGPTLPDNIAYKADLLRICVENRQLKCPNFDR